jgi:hypothetical protein
MEFLLDAFRPVLDELVALAGTALIAVASAYILKLIKKLGLENEIKAEDLSARRKTSAILYAEETGASATGDTLRPDDKLQLAVEHLIQSTPKPNWLLRLFKGKPDRSKAEADILAQLPKLGLGAAVEHNKPMVTALQGQQPEVKG